MEGVGGRFISVRENLIGVREALDHPILVSVLGLSTSLDLIVTQESLGCYGFDLSPTYEEEIVEVVPSRLCEGKPHSLS